MGCCGENVERWRGCGQNEEMWRRGGEDEGRWDAVEGVVENVEMMRGGRERIRKAKGKGR